MKNPKKEVRNSIVAKKSITDKFVKHNEGNQWYLKRNELRINEIF